MIKDTALVLEGGGMRGIFTIGVLDAFMDNSMKFPYVVGVSAGACNGCSFISEQRGRAKFSNIDMMRDYDYISVKNIIRQGNIFDTELLYDKLPNEIYPFNYDKFFNSSTGFEMVVTNCLTGRAEYLSERKDRKRLMSIILASSSLPYVAKMVTIDGTPYLDGGIVDSIPIFHAIHQGYDKAIVVLTRNKGYRKAVQQGKMLQMAQNSFRNVRYHKYPNLRKALSHRGQTYNNQLQLVEKLEEEGKILVVRPEKPIVVDRIERNVEKLTALYNEGFRIGNEFCKKYNKTKEKQ